MENPELEQRLQNWTADRVEGSIVLKRDRRAIQALRHFLKALFPERAPEYHAVTVRTLEKGSVELKLMLLDTTGAMHRVNYGYASNDPDVVLNQWSTNLGSLAVRLVRPPLFSWEGVPASEEPDFEEQYRYFSFGSQEAYRSARRRSALRNLQHNAADLDHGDLVEAIDGLCDTAHLKARAATKLGEEESTA